VTFSLSFAIVALAIVAALFFLLLAWQHRTLRRLEAKKTLAELVQMDELPGPELHVVEPDEIATRPPSPPPNWRNVGRSLAVVSGATALMLLVMAVDMAVERTDYAGSLPATGSSSQAPETTAPTISLAVSPQSEAVDVRPSTSSTQTSAPTTAPPSPATVTQTVTPSAGPTTTTLVTVPTVVPVPAVTIVTAEQQQPVPTSLPVIGGKHHERADDK
jgi:hypothetical protein